MIDKVTIGQAEYIRFSDYGDVRVPARIDTGARTSSVWASDILETPAGLSYCLFGPGNKFYTGEIIVADRFSRTVVASSNGHTQIRYKVPMTIKIRKRRIKTFCTLADRSSLGYPVLIGRNTLCGKFVVDVQKTNRRLSELDGRRHVELQSMLEKNSKGNSL